MGEGMLNLMPISRTSGRKNVPFVSIQPRDKIPHFKI
jgi:hypothetical protein